VATAIMRDNTTTQGTAPPAEREHALGLIRAKREAEGLAALARLHASHPNDSEILGHYAFAALTQRQWDTADSLLGRLQVMPGQTDSWERYYYRAWALAASGSYGPALELCLQAVQRAPERIRPRELAAAVALRTHRPQQGLEILRPVGDRSLLARLLSLESHRELSLANPCVSLWMLCSFFAQWQSDPTRIPPHGRGWVTAACDVLGRAVSIPPLPSRAAAIRRRWLWRLWGWQSGFGSWNYRCVNVPLAPGAIESYQAVLDATIDELLQIPLCALGPSLRAITRGQDALILYNWAYANRPCRYMHVGCFMGLSACVSALGVRNAGRLGGSRIYTVDPYLVGAALDPDGVFEKIATRLGVCDMIERHTGYFNHCTHEDLPAEADHDLQVIGRDLLRRIGPCDAFLIDGDHSEIGVTADVLLASEFLAPGGSILLHDVRSVASVRRGLALFLATDGIRQGLRYCELEPANVDGVGLLLKRRPGVAARLDRARHKKSSYEKEII
jgi:hypothetical protein